MPRRRNSEPSLTPLELEIMNVLWETGPANVQTVQGRIQGRELAYTTVQTMLNVLHRKGNPSSTACALKKGERCFLSVRVMGTATCYLERSFPLAWIISFSSGRS